MAHTPMVSLLERLAELGRTARHQGVGIEEVDARRRGALASGEATSRRELLKTALLAGAATTVAGRIVLRSDPAGAAPRPASQPPIAIVGAGISGMSAAMTLRDATIPTASNLAGDLIANPTWQAAMPVSFQAADSGSGVYRLVVNVDGQDALGVVADANDGRCADADATNTDPHEFLWAAPCRTSVAPQLSVPEIPIQRRPGNDTTGIRNYEARAYLSQIRLAVNAGAPSRTSVEVRAAPPGSY